MRSYKKIKKIVIRKSHRKSHRKSSFKQKSRRNKLSRRKSKTIKGGYFKEKIIQKIIDNNQDVKQKITIYYTQYRDQLLKEIPNKDKLNEFIETSFLKPLDDAKNLDIKKSLDKIKDIQRSILSLKDTNCDEVKFPTDFNAEFKEIEDNAKILDNLINYKTIVNSINKDGVQLSTDIVKQNIQKSLELLNKELLEKYFKIFNDILSKYEDKEKKLSKEDFTFIKNFGITKVEGSEEYKEGIETYDRLFNKSYAGLNVYKRFTYPYIIKYTLEKGATTLKKIKDNSDLFINLYEDYKTKIFDKFSLDDLNKVKNVFKTFASSDCQKIKESESEKVKMASLINSDLDSIKMQLDNTINFFDFSVRLQSLIPLFKEEIDWLIEKIKELYDFVVKHTDVTTYDSIKELIQIIQKTLEIKN